VGFSILEEAMMFPVDDLEARLSVRARIILDHAEHGRMKLTPLARERTIRIASDPKKEDREFLNAFDDVLPG
jgi:hypothetical protein